MHAYIYTYVHMYIRMYIHKYMHTYIYTHIYTSIIALTESPQGSKLLTSNTALGTISSILLSYTSLSEAVKYN